MGTRKKAYDATLTDPRQLLKCSEAADLLAISPRKLWSLTACGEIRAVRIDRAVRYSVEDLADFVASRTEGAQQ